MQEALPKKKKAHEGADERGHSIEGAATGVTGTGSDTVPTADPDPRRPPYDGPRGGKGSRRH
jgi:hypothetical protein